MLLHLALSGVADDEGGNSLDLGASPWCTLVVYRRLRQRGIRKQCVSLCSLCLEHVLKQCESLHSLCFDGSVSPCIACACLPRYVCMPYAGVWSLVCACNLHGLDVCMQLVRSLPREHD